LAKILARQTIFVHGHQRVCHQEALSMDGAVSSSNSSISLDRSVSSGVDHEMMLVLSCDSSAAFVVEV
jgi:hypothetical protein